MHFTFGHLFIFLLEVHKPSLSSVNRPNKFFYFKFEKASSEIQSFLDRRKNKIFFVFFVFFRNFGKLWKCEFTKKWFLVFFVFFQHLLAHSKQKTKMNFSVFPLFCLFCLFYRCSYDHVKPRLMCNFFRKKKRSFL